MKLFKPNWVTHDVDLPIFSVDIHPDGKRFATGGQGKDSGRVVIWNMVPIKNKRAERNSKVPKMLCQLDNHLACVNCVRWSASGLLASGGDDKVVMVWEYAGESEGSTLYGSKGSVENWRCIATLRSHEGDILDLAWAPHSPWLASASVDNNIVIWDTSKFPSIVTVLKGHTGMVKGVTWDPVEKYLATQSDDRTLRVWRTSDWGDSALISDPFADCGGTTHVLRLSWSPDGQYLVSAHAMNGGGPTAQIIERDAWTHNKDFVGHRKAVTCVRFNGKIFQKKTPKALKEGAHCALAIGSRDRSLSVWLTSLKRPLVVIKELFKHSVLDISWSSCGLLLAACSWDGSVAFVKFKRDELGQPLDPVEQSIIHEKLYGKAAEEEKCTVMEEPCLLNFNPSASSASQSSTHKPKSTGASKSSSTTRKPKSNDASKSSSTTCKPESKDASKLSLTTQKPKSNNASKSSSITRKPESNDALKSSSTTCKPKSNDPSKSSLTTRKPKSSSTTSKSKSNDASKSSSTTCKTESNNASKSSSTTPVQEPVKKQVETRTPDGKRRITPMFIPQSQDTKNSNKTIEAPTFTSTSKTKSSIIIEKRNNVDTSNVSKIKNSKASSSSSSSSAAAASTSTATATATTTLKNDKVVTPNVSTTKNSKASSSSATLKQKLQKDKNVVMPNIGTTITTSSLKNLKKLSLKNLKPTSLKNLKKKLKLRKKLATLNASKLKKLEASSLKSLKNKLKNGKNVVTPNVSTTIDSIASSSSSSTSLLSKLKKRDLTVKKLKDNSNNNKNDDNSNNNINIDNTPPEIKKTKLFLDKVISNNVLPALKPSSPLTRQAARYAVTVTNKENFSHLQVFRGTDTVAAWEIYMGYSAVGLVASSALLVVGLEDGSIHTFDPLKGSRPAPPLAPPAPFSKIYANGNKVMIISTCATVSVWEISTNCRLIVSTSARHLISAGCSLLTCSLYNGMPHLGFTDARAYIYNREMSTWLLVGDSQDPIWRWSAQNASTIVGSKTPKGPLSILQKALHRTSGGVIPNPGLSHNGPGILSYFEQQLLTSKTLGSSTEYAHWCIALVTFLVTQKSLEKRLRAILDELMGPTHSSALKSIWDPMILGMEKHKLLEQVLKVIGGHLKWQRLYMEYSEQLAQLQNKNN